jgi:glyoxylase-like metal-dependent hydrolase (beta-lactamase superfamily II)
VTTDSLFAWHPLTPRVWLVGGNGANSVVIADGRDVLLVDTKETGFGTALRGEVERVVGRPVTCVVSTHHHTDHAMGNSAFTADVPVIAQRRARERTMARAARALVEMAEGNGVDRFEAHVADLRDWAQYYDGHVRLTDGVRTEFESLAQQASDVMSGIVDRDARMAAVAPIAERFAPTETFDAEHALRVGRVEVELCHWGPGHTDGDVVVALPSEGIVVAADLVYVGLQPFIDAGAGGRTDEWIRRTDELLDLCGLMGRNGRPALVVPGHGEPASAEAVATQRTYFERLYEAVDDARRAGRSRADTVRLMPPGLPAERAQLLGVNLGLVFDELAQTPLGEEEISCQPG